MVAWRCVGSTRKQCASQGLCNVMVCSATRCLPTCKTCTRCGTLRDQCSQPVRSSSRSLAYGLVAPPAPGPLRRGSPKPASVPPQLVRPVRGSSSTQSRSLSLSAAVVHKGFAASTAASSADLAPDEFERLRAQDRAQKIEVFLSKGMRAVSGQQVQGT